MKDEGMANESKAYVLDTSVYKFYHTKFNHHQAPCWID